MCKSELRASFRARRNILSNRNQYAHLHLFSFYAWSAQSMSLALSCAISSHILSPSRPRFFPKCIHCVSFLHSFRCLQPFLRGVSRASYVSGDNVTRNSFGSDRALFSVSQLPMVGATILYRFYFDYIFSFLIRSVIWFCPIGSCLLCSTLFQSMPMRVCVHIYADLRDENVFSTFRMQACQVES